MVDTRIRDLSLKLTEGDLQPDDHIAVDQDAVSGGTGDATMGAVAQGIFAINESKKIGVMLQDLDGNFIFTTTYYSNTLKPITLVDGFEVSIDLIGISYDFQDKLNPTLNVDDTGYKPIRHSKYFTRNISLINFDKNTIGSGKTSFKYNLANNCWLHENEVEAGSLVYEQSTTNLSGYLLLKGVTISNSSLYPSYSWAFQNSTQTVDMTDACIVGAGGESPLGVKALGQIQNITGSISGVEMKNPPVASGVFKVDAGVDADIAHLGTVIRQYTLSMDASTQIATGTQTLGTRFPLNIFLKL